MPMFSFFSTEQVNHKHVIFAPEDVSLFKVLMTSKVSSCLELFKSIQDHLSHINRTAMALSYCRTE